MKVISILGSPRKWGNTSTVLSWVEDELGQRGHEVEHVDLMDLEIKGCAADMACQVVKDAPGCKQPDDGIALLGRILLNDLILYASPLYCWGFTAQMKALLDRGICFCKMHGPEEGIHLLKGKRMALVATAAGPENGNMDLIAETFSRYAQYQHCIESGHLLVSRCTKPDALGKEIEMRARTFASQIVGEV